jgi:nucleotide-binding universal stress UspA family protein
MKIILVPTDFSAIADNATHYALSLAKRFKGEVLIFHADEKNPNDLNKLKTEVDKIHSGQVKVGFLFSPNHLSSITVNDVVKEHNVDLIVMGTSGEAATLEKKIFGRNTTDISEHANCPVVAVPAGYTYSGITKIAYASDLNFLDKEIGKVIGLAQLLNAAVDVFHVSPVFPDLGNSEKMNVQQKLEQIKDKYDFKKINYSVEKTKRDNQIPEGIACFIDYGDADLLVMFHNHVSAFDEFISNSSTAKVIAHTKTPILVFPKSAR